MKKLFKKWARSRKQARESLQFEYLNHSSIPGTMQLVAFVGSLPFPIGTVWYRQPGRETIEILHSYVLPWARRNGVRTALHREMERGYPKYGFLTAEANRHSRPWLKKMGFKKKKIGWRLKGRDG